MQFTLAQLVATALVASLSIVQASPVNEIDTTDGSPIGTEAAVSSVESRADGFSVGVVWLDSYQRGAMGLVNVDRIPSTCFNINNPFHDSISSITIDSDISCEFYMDAGCKGAKLVVGTFNNLMGTIYQDNLSSYKCMKLSIPGTPARPGKR